MMSTLDLFTGCSLRIPFDMIIMMASDAANTVEGGLLRYFILSCVMFLWLVE